MLGIPEWWPTGSRIGVVLAHDSGRDLNDPLVEARCERVELEGGSAAGPEDLASLQVTAGWIAMTYLESASHDRHPVPGAVHATRIRGEEDA